MIRKDVVTKGYIIFVSLSIAGTITPEHAQRGFHFFSLGVSAFTIKILFICILGKRYLLMEEYRLRYGLRTYVLERACERKISQTRGGIYDYLKILPFPFPSLQNPFIQYLSSHLLFIPNSPSSPVLPAVLPLTRRCTRLTPPPMPRRRPDPSDETSLHGNSPGFSSAKKASCVRWWRTLQHMQKWGCLRLASQDTAEILPRCVGVGDRSVGLV